MLKWLSPPQVSPKVLGARHLPDPLQAGARPLLFVGNHTRFGLYDLPLLVRPLLIAQPVVCCLLHTASCGIAPVRMPSVHVLISML
jgi:hypothetical protein